MTDEELKKVIDAVDKRLNKSLEPIKNQLGDPQNGLKRVNEKLDALWGQTVKLTEDSEEIKEFLKFQKQALNQTNDNIKKIDKRLTEVENHTGIVPPPELTVT